MLSGRGQWGDVYVSPSPPPQLKGSPTPVVVSKGKVSILLPLLILIVSTRGQELAHVQMSSEAHTNEGDEKVVLTHV